MATKKHRTNNLRPGSYFLQFFSIFTGIFVVMTVIILRVMGFGLYSNIQKGLEFAQANSDFYVSQTMLREVESSLTEHLLPKLPDKPSPTDGGNMVENTNIILYDKNGTMLNRLDTYSPLNNLTLDKELLDKVVTYSTENVFNKQESYQLVTVEVTNETYPDVAYASIAINTTQIAETNKRFVTIIISVMAIFWLLSIFASLYLAKWSQKPILESYEKQKAFVENASHELRTPLAVLQNRLETLFRKPDMTILDHSESIAVSLDEVRNMRLLTTNLLNLARRDDGIKPELVTISPSFFDTIGDNYALIAEEQGKAFTFRNELNRSIVSDKTLLKQLMTILFDNAVKYTGEDGDISFVLRASDKHCHLTMSDNGIGISDSDKRKIFDRFYRVDKARTRQKGGFGLGLSLAKQIVEALGGTIKVIDNHPKGTIFDIKL